MINIRHSSEFMKNQKAASALPAQSRFEALQTDNGNALFFSISDNGRLFMSAEQNDTNVGWAGVDLLDGLTATLENKTTTAKNFAVSQNAADGSITVAASLKIEGEQSDKLYIMTGLPNKPDATWLDPAKSGARVWTIRAYDEKAHPLTKLDIAHIHLDKTRKEGAAATMVVGLRRDQSETIQNYLVETDTSRNSGVWKLFQTAEDYDTMTGMHLGKPSASRFAGMYELYTSGDQTSFTFTPLDSIYGPPAVLKLKPPEGASALGVVPLDDEGNTDLYVAADGVIHLYTPEAQIDTAEGACILNNPIVNGVDKLYAHSSRDEVVLIARNGKGELFYSKCTHENKNNSGSWSNPVPLRNNVEQIASYVNLQTGAEEIFAHIEGRKLEQYSKDPVTTAWNSNSILLEALDDMIEFTTYTSQVIVSDHNETPVPNAKIKLTASSPCNIYVNYKYASLDANVPVEVTTDNQGKLTLVQETDGLRGVSFVIEHDGCELVNIYPMNTTHQRIEDTKDITAVIVTNEKGTASSLLPESTTQKQKDGLSKSVTQLKSIDVSESGAIHPPANSDSFASTNLWGASHEDGGFHYVDGKDAMAAFGLTANPDGSISMKTGTIELDDIVNGSVEVFIGDIFRWMKHAFEDVVSHFIQVIDGVYHFFLEVGGKLYRGVLKVLGDVLDAVEFVFNKLLVEAEKLMQWLGFVFGWSDILQYKRVLHHLVELSKAKALNEIDNLEVQVEKGVAYVEEMLDKLAGLPASHDVFGQKISEASKKGAEKAPGSSSVQSSPALGWIWDHITGCLEIIKIEPDDLQKLFEEIGATLKDAAETDLKIFENAFKDINDKILGNIGTLSIGELFTNLVAIVGKSVVELAGELVITLLNAAKIIIEAIWIIVTTEIKIPVITSLYEGISEGSKLTLLDLGCLMGAIPAEIVCKFIGMPSPSNESINKFLATTTLEDFIRALDAEILPEKADTFPSRAYQSLGAVLELGGRDCALAGNATGTRMQSSPTAVDWIINVMEYCNITLFTGVFWGDITEYAIDLDPSSKAAKMAAGSLLKVTNGIRTVCSVIQNCFTAFRYFVAICRKIGMSLWLGAGLVAAGLYTIATLLLALYAMFDSFIKEKWAGIKKIWDVFSPVFSAISGIVTVIGGLFSIGSAIFTVSDMYDKRVEYYGDGDEGAKLLGADIAITILCTAQTVARALVPCALTINKNAKALDPDPETQVAIRAGCGIAIGICGLMASALSLVDGILYSGECISGYSIDKHVIPSI